MKASQLDSRAIWYAASNEDTRSECRALQPKGRRVLSITASGSRTFDLLIEDPASIISIDQNPAQTALAELLASAYRRLSYGEFRDFAGITPSTDRDRQFARLAPDLSPDARQFWEHHPKHIATGIIYCGRWEGFLRSIQKLAGSRRRDLAARLLTAATLDAQHGLWRGTWDDRRWRLFLRLLSIRFLWTHVAREPGIAFVAPDFDIYRYVRARFDHVAKHHLLSESPFAWLMLNGTYPSQALPLSERGGIRADPHADRSGAIRDGFHTGFPARLRTRQPRRRVAVGLFLLLRCRGAARRMGQSGKGRDGRRACVRKKILQQIGDRSARGVGIHA